MQPSPPPRLADRLTTEFGPAFIGVGLILLVATAVWPQLPSVSAMALIALGATDATVERLRRHASFTPWLILHCLAYSSLYALFFCASLAKADIGSSAASYLYVLDLFASTLPMTVALRSILVAFRQQRPSTS